MKTDTALIIIGALLGALISSVGWLYQRRAEKKKVLNKSLFSLLEIRSQLIRLLKLDPQEFLTGLKNYMDKYYPNYEMNESEQSVIMFVMNVFKKSIFERKLIEEDESLINIFYDSIKEISFYSPILAHKINTDHSIKSTLSLIDRYIEMLSTDNKINHTSVLNDIGSTFKDLLQESILNLNLQLLEKDLNKLAWKCGVIKYFMVRKIIKKKEKPVFDNYFFGLYVPDLMKIWSNKPQ